MENNWKNKYIKYKNKYIALKNQLGGIEPMIRDDQATLINKLGTCWNLVIQVILLNGDGTRDNIGDSVRAFMCGSGGVEAMYERNIGLFRDAFGDIISGDRDKTLIILLLESIISRLNIFYCHTDRPVTTTTRIEIPSTDEDRERILLRCESNTNSYYNQLVGRDRNSTGGDEADNFIFANIISIFFLGKLIQPTFYNLAQLSRPIDITQLEQSLGLVFTDAGQVHGNTEISGSGHVVCCYKYSGCNKYCNNSSIMNYDWVTMFSIINTFVESGIKYKLYYDTDGKYPMVLRNCTDHSIIPINPITCPNNSKPTPLFDPATFSSALDSGKLKQIGGLEQYNLVEPTNISEWQRKSQILFIRFLANRQDISVLMEYISRKSLTDAVFDDLYVNNTQLLFIFTSRSYNGLLSPFWPDDYIEEFLRIGPRLDVQDVEGSTAIMNIIKNNIGKIIHPTGFSNFRFGTIYTKRTIPDQSFQYMLRKIISTGQIGILNIRDRSGNDTIDYAIDRALERSPNSIYLDELLKYDIKINAVQFKRIMSIISKQTDAIKLLKLRINNDILDDIDFIKSIFTRDTRIKTDILEHILQVKPDLFIRLIEDDTIIMRNIFTNDEMKQPKCIAILDEIIRITLTLGKEIIGKNITQIIETMYKIDSYYAYVLIKFIKYDLSSLNIRRYDSVILYSLLESSNETIKQFIKELLQSIDLDFIITAPEEVNIVIGIIKHSSNYEVIKLLLDRCVRENRLDQLKLSNDFMNIIVTKYNVTSDIIFDFRDTYSFDLTPNHIFNAINTIRDSEIKKNFIIRVLRENLINVNHQNESGMTILMLCFKDFDLFKTILREFNPDLNIRSSNNKTIYHFIEEFAISQSRIFDDRSKALIDRYNNAVLEILKRPFLEITLGEQLLCEFDEKLVNKKPLNIDEINRLIDQGCSLSVTNDEGHNAFFLAMYSKSEDVARKILDKRSRFNLRHKDSDKKNCLWISARAKLNDIFNSLLYITSNINSSDSTLSPDDIFNTENRDDNIMFAIIASNNTDGYLALITKLNEIFKVNQSFEQKIIDLFTKTITINDVSNINILMLTIMKYNPELFKTIIDSLGSSTEIPTIQNQGIRERSLSRLINQKNSKNDDLLALALKHNINPKFPDRTNIMISIIPLIINSAYFTINFMDLDSKPISIPFVMAIKNGLYNIAKNILIKIFNTITQYRFNITMLQHFIHYHNIVIKYSLSTNTPTISSSIVEQLLMLLFSILIKINNIELQTQILEQTKILKNPRTSTDPKAIWFTRISLDLFNKIKPTIFEKINYSPRFQLVNINLDRLTPNQSANIDLLQNCIVLKPSTASDTA